MPYKDIDYDERAGIVYIRATNADVAYSQELGDYILIDRDENDNLAGIHILGVWGLDAI